MDYESYSLLTNSPNRVHSTVLGMMTSDDSGRDSREESVPLKGLTYRHSRLDDPTEKATNDERVSNTHCNEVTIPMDESAWHQGHLPGLNETIPRPFPGSKGLYEPIPRPFPPGSFSHHRNHARPPIEHQAALCEENNYISFDGEEVDGEREEQDGVRVLVTSASTPSGLQLAARSNIRQENDQCPSSIINAATSLDDSAVAEGHFLHLHFPPPHRSTVQEQRQQMECEKMTINHQQPDDADECGEKIEIDLGSASDEETCRLMNAHSKRSSDWFVCMKNLTRPSSVGVAGDHIGLDRIMSLDTARCRGSEPCVVVTGLQAPVTRPRTVSAECANFPYAATMMMNRKNEPRRKTSLLQPPRSTGTRRQSAFNPRRHTQAFLGHQEGQYDEPSMASLVTMTMHTQQSQQLPMNSTTCTGTSSAVSPGGMNPFIVGYTGGSTVDLSSSDHRGLQNPLYDVSNEFMRVTGYKQEFKRLLSKRKSQPTRQSSAPAKASLAACQSFDHDPKMDIINDESGISASSHELRGQNQATVPPHHATFRRPQPTPSPAVSSHRGSTCPPRHLGKQRSAYGRLWKEHPNTKHRLRKRKRLFYQRIKVSDFSLIFATAGIIITIIEAELSASGMIRKTEYLSLSLRALASATTLILISLIICYHAIETKIAVIDSGAEDWRVAITHERLWQCAIEVVVCSICPFPAGGVTITWDRINIYDHRTTKPISVPLDTVLSIPMFLRSYLLCRFMALHSRQFQDAATRSIAALNHIAVNFTFVLKTLMHEHPLRVLIIFTATFWVAMAWILTNCERYKADGEWAEDNHYLNSIWFVIVTFLSIGYGDIVPNTYCGRALAITTGIVGAGVSSALIAVISRKLELSRAEKHVNQFMTDSKLTRQRKEAAASVLQHTWFIHKYKNIPSEKDDTKLRVHQRKFLAAINEFRRVKWDQRKLAEQGNALVDVAKLQNDMHEQLWDMQQSQDHLVSQLTMLMQKMQELQEIIVSQNQKPSRLSLPVATNRCVPDFPSSPRVHGSPCHRSGSPPSRVRIPCAPKASIIDPTVAAVHDEEF